jgi:polysaccharide export outer membrane protein
MRNILLAGALLVVAGCGTPDIAQAPAIVRAPSDILPMPDGVDVDGRYLYALGAFDSVTVELAGMPDMVREITIDGQGMISYPFAGSVSAAGLTTTELARRLEERLRQSYIRDPHVSVNLEEQKSHVLTVDGQVNRPGLFPVTSSMTLMQAVAQAGGENEVSQLSAVLVFREVAGQQYVGLYNLEAIRFGNYQDPQVYPGDKVTVSASEARRLLGSLQGVTQLLTTPLIILLRR